MIEQEKNNLKAYIYRLKAFRLILLIIAAIVLIAQLFYAFGQIGGFMWQLEFLVLLGEAMLASLLISPLHYSILRYTSFLETGNQEDQKWGRIMLITTLVLLLIGIITFFSTVGMHGIYWFIEHRLGL